MNSYIAKLYKGGFNFENTVRNSMMVSEDDLKKQFKKTGTTIVGVKFKGGVILAADTRATSGQVVAEKNCNKIHFVAKNITVCGAGTAADCEYVTSSLSRKGFSAARIDEIKH